MTKYSKKLQSKIKHVMKEYKEGELTSGKTGKKVKSRKQALAIGFSEARKRGIKTPLAPKGTKSRTTRTKKATKATSRKK